MAFVDILNPISNYKKNGVGGLISPLSAYNDKPPPPTPVPDSIEEYLRGIQANAQSLPLQRGVDAAATLGGLYYNGKMLSAEDYQAKLDSENQKFAEAQAKGDQFSMNEAKAELDNLGKAYDFRGTGDAEVAQQSLMQQLQGADQTTGAYLDLEKKYGTQFAEEARRQLQATDPTGFALREQMGSDLSNGDNSIESLLKGGPNAPSYEQMGDSRLPQYQRLDENSLPQFGRVDRQTFQDTGEAKAGRAMLEGQTFDELAMAGQPDPALQRSAEQAARARGASSGNILGDASALQESLGVQLAQRDLDSKRRGDALSLLQSGQTTSDKANSLNQQQLEGDLASTGFNNSAAQDEFQNNNSLVGYNNSLADNSFNAAMAAVNQRNQATQNTFGAQQQVQQNQVQARQQDTANKQSFLGLQPVVSQAGQLNNLQQGASPFNPGSYSGATISPNAGQSGLEWAGQLFGAQNQILSGQAAAGAANSAGQAQVASSAASVALLAI